MLNFIIRFVVALLIITGVAFLLPTLVIFFLQVLITVSVFLVVLFVLSLFYKGKTDDEIGCIYDLYKSEASLDRGTTMILTYNL